MPITQSWRPGLSSKSGSSEIDILGAEALLGLLPNGGLANLNGLLRGESPPGSAAGAPDAKPPPPWSPRFGPCRPSTSPQDVEGIPLRTAVRIFNADDRRPPAISGIANQGLPSAAVNSLKSEIRRVRR